MKLRALIGLLTLICFSSTFAEFNRVKKFGKQIEIFLDQNDGTLPASWADLVDSEILDEDLLKSISQGKAPLSVNYSFISEEDRAKFPDGELLLIRDAPIDWPFARKKPLEVDLSELSEKQRAMFESMTDNEKPVRYLVYRNGIGRVETIWWYESDVQAMLKESGITVPEPEPYQVVFDSASTHSTAQIDGAAGFVNETDSKAINPKSLTEELSDDPIGSPVRNSLNWLLWLVAGVVLIGGIVVFTVRR